MSGDIPDPHPGDGVFDDDAATERARRSGAARMPAAGMLLVATPSLLDPNFRRTVVYLIAHSDEGTAGLVLNRRTETAVQNILPGWAQHSAKPPAIFAGGPVQLSGAMCLGVARVGVNPSEIDGTVRVAGSVVLVDLDGDADRIAQSLTGVRVFAGHSGWGDGQLAAEIAEGAWHVVPGRSRDVLAGPRDDLWFQVVRRQGFPLAWQAYLPTDPHRN